MILDEGFCLVEEDFVFHQDFFPAQKYCEVETRSASFSVLLTDLHGVLTEANGCGSESRDIPAHP